MNPEINALRKVLTQLYDTNDSIRRLLAESGIDPTRVNLNGAAQNSWSSALEEAINTGKLDALLEVVNEEYGDNNKNLQVAYATYHQSKGNHDQSLLPTIHIKGYFQNIIKKFAQTTESYIQLYFHRFANLTYSSRHSLQNIIDSVKEEQLLELLSVHKILLIVGDLGSGKTWLCQRMACQLARVYLNTASNNKNSYLPIIIDEFGRRYLSIDFKKSPIGKILELIQNELEGDIGTDNDVSIENLKSAMKTQKFLLIIDGLDEVDRDFRYEVAQGIIALSRTSNVHILLTCRKYSSESFLQYLIDENDIFSLEISELQENDVIRYLARELRDEDEQFVYTYPSFITTPFRLRILCKSYMTGQTSSRTWPNLIHRSVSSTWNKISTTNTNWVHSIEKKEEILSQIAYFSYEKYQRDPSRSELSQSEIENLISKDETPSKELLKEILTTGFLRESNGNIKFTDEAFKEYFVALFLQKRWEKYCNNKKASKSNLFFQTYMHDPRWHKPLILAIGLMEYEHAKTIIQLALRKKKRILVAKCFKELGKELSSELKGMKNGFIADLYWAFYWAKTNWMAVCLVCCLAVLILQLFIPVRGFVFRPIAYYWLASLGGWLWVDLEAKVLSWEIAIRILSISLPIYLLVNIITAVYRSYMVAYLERIVQAIVCLPVEEAQAILMRIHNSLEKSIFVINKLDYILSIAQFSLIRRADLVESIKEHNLKPASYLVYALNALEKQMKKHSNSSDIDINSSDIDVICLAVTDSRRSVYKAALSLLEEMDRRGIPTNEILAKLPYWEHEVDYFKRFELYKTFKRISKHPILPLIPTISDIEVQINKIRRAVQHRLSGENIFFVLSIAWLAIAFLIGLLLVVIRDTF